LESTYSSFERTDILISKRLTWIGKDWHDGLQRTDMVWKGLTCFRKGSRFGTDMVWKGQAGLERTDMAWKGKAGLERIDMAWKGQAGLE
jgi:hypothetical protein